MLQCDNCELFRRGADGSPQLLCDPYSNIKEPECLIKWQLLKLSTMERSHQATLDMYRRIAPLQEKMFLYLRPAEDASPIGVPVPSWGALAVVAGAVAVLGLWPGGLLEIARTAALGLL